MDVKTEGERALFTIKNISEKPLNISPDELTERFVRGDVSRTTEGSGLGLSIAQSLTELQGGIFKIEIDGDLFKASVDFPLEKKEPAALPAAMEDGTAADSLKSTQEESAAEQQDREQPDSGEQSAE